MNCRSCTAPIMWALTEKGHRMPLDPEPTDEGNIVLAHREGLVPLATVFSNASAAREGAPNADRYTSHFVTCPHAASHRRKR